MIQLFKNAILATCALFAVGIAVPALVSATTAGDIQSGVNQAAGGAESKDPGKTLGQTIETVVNILSLVIGIIAVFMVIIGGFSYITSGGNDQKVATAKNTILYAVIGLIIVAFAQLIVRFTISAANGTATSTPTGYQEGANNNLH